jgi:hypothetical protein
MDNIIHRVFYAIIFGAGRSDIFTFQKKKQVSLSLWPFPYLIFKA